MAIDLEDEILQDFLVEAGEILDELNEQLVDLEQAPDDSDLLNTIFRGFHTIKGGGSFLSLTSLVEVCHKSEDVFNLLRNNEISLDSSKMDAFLRVLDEVTKMFEEIRSGEDPTPADPGLLQELIDMQVVDGGASEEASEPEVDEAPEPEPEPEQPQVTADDDHVGGGDDISDDEFESLLDALHGSGAPKAVTDEKPEKEEDKTAASSDDITDDEFESLLDDIHGKGSAPKADVSATKKEESASSNDEMSADEFESLLDDMHGSGKGPAGKASAEPEKKAEPEPPKEKPKPAAKAKAKLKAKPAVGAAAKKDPANAPKGETTVRVDTARLDDIMNLVGELVLARNRLTTLRATFDDERVHKAISNLDVVTADLQTAVMKTRMQPVKKVFGRFPRVVRDLARSLEKEINLELVGEDTDLDKNLVEALADPLVHLVRNSVDHGVEIPAIREKAGKSREGTVILAAKQEGDHILLSITDDGAGMDPEVLRNKVVEKGLMDAESAARLVDKECFDLIFMPGLSTKENISDVSGRGVGMDVVKTKITQLNGTIDIESELGKGTVLTIKVPLTLAILPTLMVQLGSRKFALPLSIVNEIFERSSKKTNIVDGKEVVLNRGKAPPIFYLRKWLLGPEEANIEYEEDPQVIMAQVGNSSVGLVVDQVIGQEEVVIKPLGAMLHGLPGLAGSTITGDGNIAIILDVPGLLKTYT